MSLNEDHSTHRSFGHASQIGIGSNVDQSLSMRKLHILHTIRNDIGDIKADVHEIKLRVTSLEEGIDGVHRRMDRFDERLSRIEKRNELVDV